MSVFCRGALTTIVVICFTLHLAIADGNANSGIIADPNINTNIKNGIGEDDWIGSVEELPEFRRGVVRAPWPATTSQTYCSDNWNKEYSAGTKEDTLSACQAKCDADDSCLAITYGTSSLHFRDDKRCILCRAGTNTRQHSAVHVTSTVWQFAVKPEEPSRTCWCPMRGTEHIPKPESSWHCSPQGEVDDETGPGYARCIIDACGSKTKCAPLHGCVPCTVDPLTAPKPTQKPTAPTDIPRCCSKWKWENENKCVEKIGSCVESEQNCGSCDGTWFTSAPAEIPINGICCNRRSWENENKCEEKTGSCVQSEDNCGNCDGIWIGPGETTEAPTNTPTAEPLNMKGKCCSKWKWEHKNECKEKTGWCVKETKPENCGKCGGVWT